MKKPLRQNVFSYAYLAGQNVLLKVRNTSAINMGPIRYDTAAPQSTEAIGNSFRFKQINKLYFHIAIAGKSCQDF